MESAIPEYLRVAKTRPNSTPKGYTPPFPAWTTRFAEDTSQVVMMYFGIQSKQKINFQQLTVIIDYLKQDHSPGYWTPAEYVDAQGFHHLVITAYWVDQVIFNDWFKQSGFETWWNAVEREQGQVGYFLEITCPSISEFETIFSNPSSPEGIAHLSNVMSEEILEHGYYGSMRDRLPIAQSDPLIGSTLDKHKLQPKSAHRVQIMGNDYLSLIRSGQDWTETEAEERALYLNNVEPILNQGMQFLRDEGLAEGCLNCRYMTVLDPETGLATDKSFGLAYFQDLQYLEKWAKSHPTHVAIFGEFMNYVQRMNFQIKLKLFHEVISVPAQAQFFEYINCHSQTGLMNALNGEAK
ncbi:phenylacetaldoxime dehydratase family protein [Acinetobacter sp. V91_7]|uniref:phenylacetaldoxime dehydratase family protein n=1 Tax=unclassified Acinetobacter TaxID=196816 RepID=UPI00287DFF4A|nr:MULTISPECIES: phenylacetaldoxime dehydratase family protein [unclassified Acinetobacter]MDS7932892.1 phenylacetaldoxime dehydratase family protein [Acinetobacter sp. V91_4B]MDS7961847.1 phenylacetaldoxime dehydratase family protein [Acinetobacter sp. V91_7]MDS8028920.1 phenylacetaldoxime dehydratase family protein [Acinetobacter sp. V91_13]